MTNPDLIIRLPEPGERPHLVTGDPTTNPAPLLHLDAGGSQVWHGDCIEVMSQLPAESFDAIVTDPPYGLEFMGREWDRFPASGTVQNRVAEGADKSHPFRDGSTRIRYGRSDPRAFQQWCEDWATQALRVLKPGGHLLAFGGSRTWHRLVAGIEDAGFEVRDGIAWLYSSGFPKSLDVSEAMARYQADGPTVSAETYPAGMFDVTGFLKAARDAAGWKNRQIDALFGTNGMAGHWVSGGSQPAVPSPRQWDQLRDALGFDDLVRVGDDGPTIRELAHRLGSEERPEDWGTGPDGGGVFLAALQNKPDAEPAGGWGTALVPSFEPIAVARKPFPSSVAANLLQYGTGALNIDGTRIPTDEQYVTAGGTPDRDNAVLGHGLGVSREQNPGGRWPKNALLTHAPTCTLSTCATGCPVRELDAQTRGEASRYFTAFRYAAKAPTHERPSVVDEQGNTVQHPTVKPVGLMRWLARLVTPPGGRILEPFAGSGTTVEAAIVEGFECVAIELGAEHLPLIEKRLMKDHQQTLFGDL